MGYGDVIDILVQKRRNKRAAARFFRKLLRGETAAPTEIVVPVQPRRRGAPRRGMRLDKWP